MRVSLCTWCRDWPDIRRTLPVNIALTKGLDVELCVADVGSRDDTVQWLLSLDEPRLHAQGLMLEFLHFARAYNLSHRMATGEILCCVDADNVVGPRYIERVVKEISADPKAIIHAWTGDWLDGTCGRIAMHRDLFDVVGGYDESLEPVGYQDLDLRDRAQAAGGRVIVIHDPDVVGLAIKTPDGKKVQHIQGNYGEMNARNQQKSRANVLAGRLKANTA